MSKTAEAFEKLFETTRKHLEYFVQGAIIEFTESVVERMEEMDISKSVLAERLDCKPSYVTKVLRGGTNFTLESMVKIALALDSEIKIGLVPKLYAEKMDDVLKAFTGFQPARQQKLNFDLGHSREKLIQLPQNQNVTFSDECIISIAA